MLALEPEKGDLWRCGGKDENGADTFRLCSNYTDYGICNWALPIDRPGPVC
jgi:hypothetical protein